jgi:signal transduction histidine kinase
LINFISNANKFTKNGIILVRIDQFNGCIRITVKDSGNGMKKEILDQIGEDYMTFGNNTNQNEHGIGLGLSLCK